MIATERDLDLILGRILAHSDPTVVYLFGSYGRGEAHGDSDIDLLIVGDSDLPRRHRGKHVAAALRDFPARFDLLFYTPDELADELADPVSFASNATGGGRVIYDRRAHS